MMRRALPVALLSVLLVVFPSAFAQRGGSSGGHGGGFGGHSFGGGSIGHFSAPAFSGPGQMPGFPTHSFGTAPRMTFTAPARAFYPPTASPSMNYRDRGWNGGGGNRGRNDGGRYRAPYRGYGYGGYAGYPYYVNSWELLPSYLDESDFSGDDSADQQAQQPAAEAGAPEDNGYRPGYEEPPDGAYGPPPEGYAAGAYAPPPPGRPVFPEPQLTLIFKDGHQETIQNYALTPETVIVMDQPSSGRQQRIPLADLNLPATEQAAQQAGLDFSPPS